jgi:hypothetical protein
VGAELVLGAVLVVALAAGTGATLVAAVEAALVAIQEIRVILLLKIGQLI